MPHGSLQNILGEDFNTAAWPSDFWWREEQHGNISFLNKMCSTCDDAFLQNSWCIVCDLRYSSRLNTTWMKGCCCCCRHLTCALFYFLTLPLGLTAGVSIVCLIYLSERLLSVSAILLLLKVSGCVFIQTFCRFKTNLPAADKRNHPKKSGCVSMTTVIRKVT